MQICHHIGFYDSLHGSSEPWVSLLLRHFKDHLRLNFSDDTDATDYYSPDNWTVDEAPAPYIMQQDATSCGVYTILFADLLTAGLPCPITTHFNNTFIHDLRLHYARSLILWTLPPITPIPLTHRPTVPTVLPLAVSLPENSSITFTPPTSPIDLEEPDTPISAHQPNPYSLTSVCSIPSHPDVSCTVRDIAVQHAFTAYRSALHRIRTARIALAFTLKHQVLVKYVDRADSLRDGQRILKNMLRKGTKRLKNKLHFVG